MCFQLYQRLWHCITMYNVILEGAMRVWSRNGLVLSLYPFDPLSAKWTRFLQSCLTSFTVCFTGSFVYHGASGELYQSMLDYHSCSIEFCTCIQLKPDSRVCACLPRARKTKWRPCYHVLVPLFAYLYFNLLSYMPILSIWVTTC